MDLRDMRSLLECGCGGCPNCGGPEESQEDDKKPMKPMKVKIKNGFMQMAKKNEDLYAMVGESVEDVIKRATAVSKFRDELEGAGLRFSFMNGVSVRGKTYPVKDVLSKYGFKFSGKGDSASWSRKSMNDLDFHDFYADLTKAMKQGKSEQPKVKKEDVYAKYVGPLDEIRTLLGG